MELKEALIQSCSEMMPMFGLSIELVDEKVEKTLHSAEQVNILIGFANGLKGNLVIGLAKDTALKIASAMMGGMEILELDFMTKSALGELSNMLLGSAVIKLASDTVIDLSPPTLAIGKDLFLMISRIPSTRLTFQISECSFNIAYSIE